MRRARVCFLLGTTRILVLSDFASEQSLQRLLRDHCKWPCQIIYWRQMMMMRSLQLPREWCIARVRQQPSREYPGDRVWTQNHNCMLERKPMRGQTVLFQLSRQSQCSRQSERHSHCEKDYGLKRAQAREQ